MTARRLPRAAQLAALGLAAALLSGCAGMTDTLVGVHAAPSEQPAAAPLDQDSATVIAAKVISQAQAAAALSGDEAKAAREAALAGNALTMAEAAASRGVKPETSDLSKDAQPIVVAQSQGREWPRVILATTLDQASTTQTLYLMVSSAPDQPFRLTDTAPMFGGAELPAVGVPGEGAPLVAIDDGEGVVMAPKDAFATYAAALAYPKGGPTDKVSIDDRFATNLLTNSKAQTKAFGDLATFSQAHKPILDDVHSLRLANGGIVTFGLMERTDTAKSTSKAKELRLPAEYAKLVGKDKVTQSFQLRSLEPVVLVIPTSGTVSAIAASELVVSGSGK